MKDISWKPLYTLTYYDEGKVRTTTTTTDKEKARKDYRRYYIQNGIAPRVHIDKKRLTIAEADKFFGLQKFALGKTTKPKYVNRHQLKAIQSL